jgi:flagellin-specific chaperone FliS
VSALRTTRRSRTGSPRRLSEEGVTYREPIRKYLEQEISAAHSVDLVIYAFDYAIAACVARDAVKASKSLTLLEQSLNPHAFPELGHTLAGIYRFCRMLLGEQKFDEALFYLRILRSAWTEVKAKA